MSATQTMAVQASPWVDRKRYWWLLSPAIPLAGLASVLAVINGAPGWLLWTLPVIFYVIAPIMDLVIGEDSVNAPESAVSALENDKYYLRIVYAYLPSQYLMTVAAAWLAVSGTLSGIEWLALILGTGIANGVGINTAHELGHKTHSFERWMAKLTLAPVAYGHFFIEHNKGHHKNVATPEDPASSRMGESFWAFLPRTVIGSVRSAWGIERGRLERIGGRVLSLDNELIQAWGMTVLLFGALSLWLGPVALLFLIAQAIFGFSLLEVVNYLEHYGLCRQKLPSGRYERCQPRHSWNSNHVVTNLLLYQLQRHSDHHANPTRSFQALRHFDDSPQLPSGYAAMILLAYFPPLWFRVMDPKVAAHHRGDLRGANLQPSQRNRLMTRWHTADDSPVDTATDSAAPSPEASATSDAMQCPNCAYIYRAEQGCPHEGYPAGTHWSALPESFQCPDCAVRDKPDFKPAH